MTASKDPSPTKKVIVKGNNYEYPFSRGLLAHSAVQRGINYSEAYAIARKIYFELNKKSRETKKKRYYITENEVSQLVEKYAEKICDPILSHQIKIVNHWLQMGKPIVILIAGVAGSNVDFIGKYLAERLAIDQIVSTSVIAQILRKVIAPEIAPELHTETYLAHNKLRPIYSAVYDKILIGYEENSKFITKAIESLTLRALKEGTSIVIRGEHLIPSFLSKELLDRKNVFFLTVGAGGINQHLKRLSSEIRTKKLDQQILNFQSIRKMNDFLKIRSEEIQLKVFENNAEEETIAKEVAEYIITQLETIEDKDFESS